MSFVSVPRVADAVLYEGYMLYPYRRSSLKNQERWTFGVLRPRAASQAEGGLEPWSQESECLVEGDATAAIGAKARFLQPSGDGATAREVDLEADLGRLAAGPVRRTFAFDDGVEGSVELSARPAAEGAWFLAARIANESPFAPGEDRGRLASASLAATHLVLAVRGGAFVSLRDPPDALRTAALECRQGGAWPILVGPPGSRDRVLCSPIILEDHADVAPESPGDLFDGTEIDEILTLRIATLTEAERREAAAADERVAAVLARCDALGPAELARLHGALRAPRSPAYAPGARVRLRPRARADILDRALAGKEATIVAVEQDWDGRAWLAVTVDDDPGRDLGSRGYSGHRFFFAPDEVEPLPRSAPR